MPLSASQETVLEELVEKLSDSATWCVIGSTDSVLRGLDDDPSDIDILATEAAAKQFRDRFSDGFTDTREVGQSQIDTYVVHGEEVEVIFCHREKSHQTPLIDLERIEVVQTENSGVPLLPLEHLVTVYEQIGKQETVVRLQSELGVSAR
ncbi:hypothetical protein C455_16053 [Haloferax larsenii JCM 13917]|nr:hypothetical protein [Haloferax larsenii]ELZ75522.1 hypothetical protein C455_16053 [Haloferax larsenii JCM 13917]